MSIIPLILCGGRGTRLAKFCPGKPKQFQALFNRYTLLQNTLLRLTTSTGKSGRESLFSPPILVSNKDYHDEVLAQLNSIRWRDFALLLEPENKNTGPAILASLKHIRQYCSLDTRVIILPSDHFIDDNEGFTIFIREINRIYLENKLNDKVMLFGIKPYNVNSEYGHMLVRDSSCPTVKYLDKFIEKPDIGQIESLSSSKKTLLWNSGIFFGTISAFCKLIAVGMDAIANQVGVWSAAQWGKESDALSVDRAEGGYYDRANNKVFIQEQERVNRIFSALPAFAFDDLINSATSQAMVAPVHDAFRWYDMGNSVSLMIFQAQHKRGG